MSKLATQFVPVDRGRLAYDEAGDGPAVVLLHSGGADRRVWDAQMETFAVDHRVVRFDLRGHGESSTHDGPFAHHADVAAAVEALGLGPCAVVGVSLGAGTAVELALETQALFTRVVAVGAGVPQVEFSEPWALDLQARLADAARAGDPQRWIETDLAWFDGPHRTPEQSDPVLRERFGAMLEHTVMTHVVAGGPPDAQFVPDTASRLGEITAPLLGVIGELDAPDHRRMVTELVDGVGDGRLVTIRDAVHHPMMEQPEAFDAAVLPFIAAVRA